MSAAGLRADAQRNLERVLDAATEVFAASGPDSSIDEIARRAGVGHATVVRRFPTKEALMAAVVCRRMDDFVAFAKELAERPDPWQAFCEFVWFAGDAHASDRALHDALGRCVDVPDVAAAKAELNELVEALVTRAQDAGALRRDVGAEDVSALVGSAIKATARSGDREIWRRYVEVVLDGLRAPRD
jgi:AcrR family transcriptional regulator